MTDPEDIVDPLPLLIADLDQYLKNVRFVAQIAKASYNAYRDEGFTEKQALFLAGMAINRPDTPSED